MGNVTAPVSEEASSMDRTGAHPLRPYDPERIGPYALRGRIGEGGMGTVYLAEAPETGRLVAVKVVKAEFTVDEGFAARFHSEVANARRVASFCTAQVLDNGNAEDGRPYMVTEFIPGTPLSRQITKYGALEAGTLHGVALGVAAALAAIHVAGLVHRDLKPANVILSMSGPRVIDFGIARALDATQGVTRSGELLGSPGWWAPEQVRGEEITPAADVFAWGCLVAYAGNGRHPYGRGDMLTLASRVLNGRPDLGELPTPLDRLVRLATDADPSRRPTAQELLIALVGGGALTEPVPVDPPTLIAQPEAPTLVASELLESWQPPANLATPDLPTPTPAPLPAVPRQAVPGQAVPGQTFPHQAVPQQAAVPMAPPPATALPYPFNATEPVAPVEDETRPPETGNMPTVPGTGTKERARKWLVPALAVVGALVVSAAVLSMVVQQDRRPGRAVAASAAAVVPTRVTDVARWFSFDAPYAGAQFVVPSAPRCGLTSYEGVTPDEGRLCVVPWTLSNPGGTEARITPAPPTLLDDRGAEHQPLPVSTAFPATMTPGAKIDGVLVYDLAPARGPATLTLKVSESKTIEVRL